MLLGTEGILVIDEREQDGILEKAVVRKAIYLLLQRKRDHFTTLHFRPSMFLHRLEGLQREVGRRRDADCGVDVVDSAACDPALRTAKVLAFEAKLSLLLLCVIRTVRFSEP